MGSNPPISTWKSSSFKLSSFERAYQTIIKLKNHAISSCLFQESTLIPNLTSGERPRLNRYSLRCRASKELDNFSSHSLRRGGATFAHILGVSDAEIAFQGGWRSDCYRDYFADVGGEAAMFTASF
jgi:hypothetical protein